EKKHLPIGSFSRYKADKVLQLLVKYKMIVRNGPVKLRNKLFNLFVHGIYNFKIYKYRPDDVILFLQKLYYDLKTKELNSEIEALVRKLETYDFEHAMNQYTEDSM